MDTSLILLSGLTSGSAEVSVRQPDVTTSLVRFLLDLQLTDCTLKYSVLADVAS